MSSPHRRMYLAAFLLDFSVAIGLTAMPFLIYERLGGGPGLSGAVGAFQMALYAGGCLLSARFVARAADGLRWALAGVGVFAAFFALVPWISAPTLCGAVASLHFLGLALAWPALLAWIGGEPDPERRARRLTRFNMATAFGFTLSPLLAGPLYDLDYRLPFVVLVAMCAAVTGLILSLPRDETARAEDAPRATADPDGTPAVHEGKGLLYASWGATFTASGLFACVRSVYPKRVESLAADTALTFVAGLRPVWLASLGPAASFSSLAFLLSLATVACFAILGGTTSWRGRFVIPAAGQLVAAASFIVLGQTRSLAAMMACFALVGANFGLCFYASLFYSLAHADAKHRRAAINEGMLGAGGFAGGIGAGCAAALFGVTAAFQWAPLCVVAAVAVQTILLRACRS